MTLLTINTTILQFPANIWSNLCDLGVLIEYSDGLRLTHKLYNRNKIRKDYNSVRIERFFPNFYVISDKKWDLRQELWNGCVISIKECAEVLVRRVLGSTVVVGNPPLSFSYKLLNLDLGFGCCPFFRKCFVWLKEMKNRTQFSHNSEAREHGWGSILLFELWQGALLTKSK